MIILTFFAYTCFGLAALLVIFALGEGQPVFLTAAISLVVSGVLFMALNKVIETLTQIRDAINGKEQRSPSDVTAVTPKDVETEFDPQASEATTHKSLAELSNDLEKLKKKQNN